jgi:hypothetical protein
VADDGLRLVDDDQFKSRRHALMDAGVVQGLDLRVTGYGLLRMRGGILGNKKSVG